jgi:1-acyl-sn-glycerol-3-phosphate acyltransferase
MALGPIRAEIIFHPPVTPSDYANRKRLAQHCETVISDGYRRLMRAQLAWPSRAPHAMQN